MIKLFLGCFFMGETIGKADLLPEILEVNESAYWFTVVVPWIYIIETCFLLVERRHLNLHNYRTFNKLGIQHFFFTTALGLWGLTFAYNE